MSPIHREFAKMLADPCYGPMVTGLSSGANGGILARFRTSVDPGTTSCGAGIIHWVPGIAVCAGAGYSFQRSLGVFWPSPAQGVGDALSCNWAIFGPKQPGMAFNDSGAFASARCQAACLRLRYTGSEMDRSGQWGAWNSGGAYIDPAQTVSPAVDNVLATCPDIRRVGDPLEIVWRPTSSDAEPRNLYVDSKSLAARCGGVTAVWSGLKTATNNFTADLIAVVEFFPDYNVGGFVPTRMQQAPGPEQENMPGLLDQMKPGWDLAHIGSMAMSLASMVAPQVVSGISVPGMTHGVAKMFLGM